MHPTTEPPIWVTVTEAADESEIPARTLRRWADLGFLPVQREGRRVKVDLSAIAVLRRTLAPPRHQPLRRGLAGPPPPAGIAVSWPEVDLLLLALHDASELRAAIWAATGREGALDQAARYALLAARFALARDAAHPRAEAASR